MDISVVVTTYNHKTYIEECLNSILEQQTTYSFEIILGEDDSKDGTREICMAYAKRFPDKIKLFLRSRKDAIIINGKPTGRYNFTENIKAAKGRYIALCEGDDYWTDPKKLQKQVDFLEANKNYAGCFHNVMYSHYSKPKDTYNWRTYNRSDFYQIDTITTRALFHTSSYVFRNDDFQFPDWFFQIVSGDMALLAIISKKGDLKLLDGSMSVYRKHEGGITANERKIQFHNDRIQLIDQLNDFFDKTYDDKAKKVMDFHKTEIDQLRHKSIKKIIKRIKNRLQ